MGLPKRSTLGEELKSRERTAVFRGICPDCGRDALIDGGKLGAAVIVCMTVSCDFAVRVEHRGMHAVAKSA